MRGRRGPEEVTRRERAGRRGDAWDRTALKRGARLWSYSASCFLEKLSVPKKPLQRRSLTTPWPCTHGCYEVPEGSRATVTDCRGELSPPAAMELTVRHKWPEHPWRQKHHRPRGQRGSWPGLRFWVSAPPAPRAAPPSSASASDSPVTELLNKCI